jgi:hypothetical protein
MKTMNFFKAAMIAVVAMVMTTSTANAASDNDATVTATETSETFYVDAGTTETVRAKSSDKYTYRFYAGETVYIYVNGDGDTYLDLYVYDENGNLIDSDTDYGDTCLCSFTPRWTGRFTIKVKNLGNVYNRYKIRCIQ